MRNYHGVGRYYLTDHNIINDDVTFVRWLDSLQEARDIVEKGEAIWSWQLLDEEK
jgi:hypothetical protein